MTNILFVRSAGMSTSMMVKKVQGAAVEKKIEAEIWAVGDADAVNNVEKMDVMLSGLRVRFLESKMKTIARGKPAAVIDIQAYGTINGAKVLEQALELLGV